MIVSRADDPLAVGARQDVPPSTTGEIERWPGWIRIAVIVGLNAALWVLLLHAF